MCFKLLMEEGKEEKEPVYDKVKALYAKKLVAYCDTNKILDLYLAKILNFQKAFDALICLLQDS